MTPDMHNLPSPLPLRDTSDLLCVLLVEPDIEDARRTQALLAAADHVEYTVDLVMTVDDAHKALTDSMYDVVLMADQVGTWTGLEMVLTVDQEDPFLPPFILLAREDDREADLAAQDAGLADYLVKPQITPPLLERSIRYALERKQTEQRLRQLAFYDSLTSLPNRATFRSELERRISDASFAKSSFGLILLDLDDFKDVNDQHGHPVGDHLLQAVSQRLKDCTDDRAFLARLGGDEFVVCTGLDFDAAAVQELADAVIATVAAPYTLDEHEILTTTSVGISLYPADGTSYTDLLKHADMALYRAKNAGRGTWARYQPEPVGV